MSESDEEVPGPAAAAGKPAKNVNLFFGSRGELTEVVKKDDASTAYIIFQNDRLHAQVDRMQRRIKDLERDLNRAVDDSDRAERSRTCLRGMLHNEIEKGRIVTDINDRLRDHREATSGLLQQMGVVAVAHAAVALGVHALAWAWPDDSLASFSVAVHLGNAAVFGWMCHCASTRAKADSTAAEVALAELGEQMASAARGTEHLHDIVDEL